MYNLTNKQFNYQQRYQAIGLGKDDITNLEGEVSRVQEGDMKESNKVKDFTFTFWFRPFSKPGAVLRCTAMGALAEQLHKQVEEGCTALISGNIITSRTGPWVKLSDGEVKADGRIQPAADEL
jgi:hypothetical protein